MYFSDVTVQRLAQPQQQMDPTVNLVMNSISEALESDSQLEVEKLGNSITWLLLGVDEHVGRNQLSRKQRL